LFERAGPDRYRLIGDSGSGPNGTACSG